MICGTGHLLRDEGVEKLGRKRPYIYIFLGMCRFNDKYRRFGSLDVIDSSIQSINRSFPRIQFDCFPSIETTSFLRISSRQFSPDT